MPEWGIDIVSLLNECPKVHSELVYQRFEVFFEEPDEDNLSLVMGFYVNALRRRITFVW